MVLSGRYGEAGEDPAAAAVRALHLGGMRLDFKSNHDIATTGGIHHDDSSTKGDAKLTTTTTTTTSSSPGHHHRRLTSVVIERARLRFTGWLDVPVIEHEFTCQLDDGHLKLEEALDDTSDYCVIRGDGGATLVGAPPPYDDAGGGEGEEGRRKGTTEGTMMMEPRWFDESDIPYHEMPDDDRHWYPPALALAAKASHLTTASALVSASIDPSYGQPSISAGEEMGGSGSGGGETERAGAKKVGAEPWELTREIIVGEFHFEGDELARHHLKTILTDA